MPVEENLMQAILLTFGTAMVPVLELRGAIPVGVAAGLSPAAACLVSILGNMVPVPFILLLIRRIFDWLRRGACRRRHGGAPVLRPGKGVSGPVINGSGRP